MTWNIKLHSCWWYYVFILKGCWVERRRKKKRAAFLQVWNLWLFQLCIAFSPFLPHLFSCCCFLGFWLQFKGRHFRCKSGNEGGRSLSFQCRRIIIVYSISSVSTEMQWIVWFNVKMWFIFTVNAKSFKFASVHIHYILGLQTSKLWMIQIVNNNKMSSHIHF